MPTLIGVFKHGLGQIGQAQQLYPADAILELLAHSVPPFVPSLMRYGLGRLGTANLGDTGFVPTPTPLLLGVHKHGLGQIGQTQQLYPADVILELLAHPVPNFLLSWMRHGANRFGTANIGDTAAVPEFSLHQNVGVKQYLNKPSLQGRVTYQGVGVPFADIWVILNKTKTILRLGKTDSEGNIDLPVFGNQEYIVMVFKESLEGTNAAVSARIVTPGAQA